MLTSNQRQLLLLNSGLPVDHELDRDELLQEIFESAADRFPNRPAVETATATLTYRQLEDQANRLARHLRSRGIGVEDKVVLQLERDECLYLAILGILKAGAACVPLDADCSPEHAAFVLEDCQAKLCIAAKPLRLPQANAGTAPIPLLPLSPDFAFNQPATRLTRADTGAGPANLAAVIYAPDPDGGKPRGCLLEHRNLTNQARSAASVYGVTGEDRVFQGFSPAADAALGEMWLAFLPGATLIAGSREVLAAGPSLADMLGVLQVSVIVSAPTLLARFERDIPTLKVIVLGGEPCPAVLAARWHRPGRHIFNTYRSTEAGIAATAARLEPNAPVSVGFPLPNYKVYIVGPDLQLLPPGETGELCLGGPAVARGYLNRDALNQAKFIELETFTPGSRERVFRTGDQARFDELGDITLAAGGDHRVTLRGFTVELPEVEAALLQVQGVLAASVAPTPDALQLAAYVVTRGGRDLNRKVVAETLSRQLPAYMIPSWLDVLPALPAGASGAVDRKLLPPPVQPLAGGGRPMTAARDPVEKRLYEVWSGLFARKDISVDDDFFLDLGGDSRLAARMVSSLREEGRFARLSVGDLYRHPTLEGLAKLFTEKPGAAAAKTSLLRPFLPVGEEAHRRAAIWQAGLLPAVFLLHAWVWLGSFLVFDWLLEADYPVLFAAVTALAIHLASMPVLLAGAVALKWLLLGKIRPGEFPLWGGRHVRFWFMRRILAALPLRFLAGTPALCLFYRCLGAKIGRNVYIGNANAAAFDLLEIGDGSAIGVETVVDGHWVEGGRLCFDYVKIGSGCVVGNRSVVKPGASLADEATLADLSLLDEKRRIPSLEIWSGSPAAFLAHRLPKDTPVCWSPGNSLPLLLGSFSLPLLGLLPLYPGIFLIAWFNWYDTARQYFLAVPLIAISFIPLVCLEAAFLKKYLIPNVEEGRYPINSWRYVRHWLFNAVYQECLGVAGSVFTTIYLGYWFRLLGAKLGKGAKVASVHGVQPSLLRIGDYCRIAPEVILGAPQVAHGFFTVGKVHLGEGASLGHGAVVPAGSVIGKRCRLGCLSLAPDNGHTTEGSAWFGSPPLFLTGRRQNGAGAEAARGWKRIRLPLRYFWDALRIVIPNLLFVGMAAAVLGQMLRVGKISPWLVVPALPFSCFLMTAVAFLAIVVLKWLLMGRGGARRGELVAGAYDHFGSRYFLQPLMGTPFLAWPLRLLGMRVGRRVGLESVRFSGMDRIAIGDDAYISPQAVILANMDGEGNLTAGSVQVGDRAGVGANAYLLPDSRLGAEANLEALSLAMRGETFGDGTSWHGIPCRPRQ